MENRKRLARHIRVSILVLVDLAHELFSTTGSSSRYSFSFNPCFSGSCSRIRQAKVFQDGLYEVSILVLVDLAHEYNLKVYDLFET